MPRPSPFSKKGFAAEELACKRGPDGQSVMHALLRIGDSLVMMTGEWPDMHERFPATAGLWLYVDDVDTWFERAVAAGATVAMPVMDAFWGDRMGKVVDPFGHAWSIATHREDLSGEEIDRRAAAWFSGQRG